MMCKKWILIRRDSDEKDRENCGWAPSFSVVKIVEDMEI